MDEITASLTPQTTRQPLSDATNRLNAYDPPKEEDRGQYEEWPKSPDRMSIVTSPCSSKGYAVHNRISSITDSQTGSTRNSISPAPFISGKGKRKTHVGPWQLGRTLGKGATGRVRLAKHAVTGQTAAVKIVSKKSAAMVQSESIAAMDRNVRNFSGGGVRPMPCGIEREVVIMKLIEHPNVISLYDVWENRGELYLVLEYVDGGELFDYVSENGPLPEEEAVRLFRQIIAGLGYCHRFNICHRDLKPENILLDSSHNIKLADFGMAALQPAGHWLNTSCGSPHYAAPEIIYGRKYRGDRADTWSCGIILYALLTGFLPFDGGDLPNTLRLVKKGEYFIPDELSYEATDLIQQILQKKPENRISIQEMWEHPLLTKYEKLHQAMSSHAVGPPPPLSTQDCGALVASRKDIDTDLLRNLQTLWHGVKPEALIERVLCIYPTHERMFYNALVKFRDEQLENYEGQPLEYSASDYHHISRHPWVRRHSSRRQGSFRRRSNFSVLKDRSQRNSSLRGPVASGALGSYDSLGPSVTARKHQHAQATIQHKSSEANHGPSTTGTVKSPSKLAKANPAEEVESVESSPYVVLQNKKKANSVKSFQSKASYTKSRRGLNTAPATRSVSYKRNVSFRHARNRSQGSASENANNKTRIPEPIPIREGSLSRATRASDMERSPSLPAQPTTVRNGGVEARTGILVRKVRDTDIVWKDEARKVSHELSQICEEAFNTSSVSTVRTSSGYESPDTPATSVSMVSPANSHHLLAGNKSHGRPFPEKPPATPRSCTVAELAETRRKLIEHSTHGGSDKVPTYLTGVITHLDRLIEQDKLMKVSKPDGQDEMAHQLPDPFSRSSQDAGYLPAIREELLTAIESAGDIGCKQKEQKSPSKSFASTYTARPSHDAKQTIRLVSHSSLGSIEEIKPLNVRNKTQPAQSLDDSQPAAEDQKAHFGSTKHDYLSTGLFPSGSRQLQHPCELDTIDEMPKTPTRADTKTSDKKWSWFRHKPHVPEQGSPQASENIQHACAKSASVAVEEVDQSKDSEHSNRKTSSEKFKGSFFMKFIKRRRGNNNHGKPSDPKPTDPNVLSKDNGESDTETDIPSKPIQRKKSTKGKSHNWFARVFQIKPTSRVLAMDTTKVKGRKEVFKILRDWEQYGMEDVYMDKANNVVHGRVGEVNFLRLRPVEFSAEFYTVLEHGRQANLSLVRFRQERGAASSFNKVADALQAVMRQRHILVEDPARAKKMVKVLDAFPN